MYIIVNVLIFAHVHIRLYFYLRIYARYGHKLASTSDIDAASRRVLDRHAPLTTVTHRVTWREPWLNSTVTDARRERRQAERRYRAHKSSHDHPTAKNSQELLILKTNFVEKCKLVVKLIKDTKRDYYSSRINTAHNQLIIFQTFNHLTSGHVNTTLPNNILETEQPDIFANFLTSKIKKIRDNLDQQLTTPPHHAFFSHSNTKHDPGCTFSDFKPITQEYLSELLNASRLKVCALDPLPLCLATPSLLCSYLTMSTS